MKGYTAPSFVALTAMIAVFLQSTLASATSAPSVPVSIGHSVAPLYGPWKFRAGDDPDWAKPEHDDSDWETLDLTPAPSAHDSDVGLSGYVSGWNAKGHAGYFGFAWYRLHLSLTAPPASQLALLGPPAVDSAYQMFVNGRLVGGTGDFSGRAPRAFSIQPQRFPLPQFSSADLSGTPEVLAIRVWMGPWATEDPTAGGIHIAPMIGEAAGIDGRYRLQWLQTVSGYIVEVAEALLFVLLAVMACSLIPLDRTNPAYRALAVALLLIALYRANQAFFFWTQYESFRDFELLVPVLLIPLILAAWTLAWCAWFACHQVVQIRRTVAVLTLIYMGAQFCCRSWFYDVVSHSLRGGLHTTISCVRLAFLAILTYICIQGLRLRGRDGWLPLLALITIAVGLFAQELSAIHIPGIWFPFGTGVSRTQFAYAAFDVLLFVLLLRQLYALAVPEDQMRMAKTE
jgi:hypothetical protein